MALNFRVKKSKAGDELRLFLTGDFDGSSAFELLKDMKDQKSAGTKRIVINTDGIQRVHPFGKAIFEKELPFTRILNKNIIFQGRNADKIVDKRIAN